MLLAGVLFTSCEDLLDAPNKSDIDGSAVFSIEALADAAVMGIHQSFSETNSYRGRYLAYFGVNNDCEIYNNTGMDNVATHQEGSLISYSATPTNTYMNTDNNVWGKLYEGIERANKGLYEMEHNGDLTNQNIRQLYGELLALRAYIYFDLVKAFGDIPARFEPISSETLYLAKSERMEILNRIMADLLLAQDYLGWPNENNYTKSPERVSKAFAKGLRARIALFAAGYSQHPDGIRYNIEDAAQRQEMYRIAQQECVDVIQKGSNILGSFEDNFRQLCGEQEQAGLESLFELPFSSGRGRVIFTWGVRHQKADQWTGLARGGANGPMPTLFYDYDPEDVRRNITCVPYWWSNEDVSVKEPNKCYGGWSFGKVRFEWLNRRVTSTNDDGMNWQVMRYADIFLIAAEATNELDGPAAAQQYLKPILDRSYPAAKATSILNSAAASKDAFFNEIVDQRMFEFAGEALRKVDLIRWNLLGTKMAEAKAKMTRLMNREGEYADLPAKIYYNEGLDAASNDADTYYIYGLEHGDTDAMGEELINQGTLTMSKTWAQPTSDSEIATVTKFINQLYVNDPDTRQFWPIWQVFIDSSNGMLTNDYNY
jgi:hypothetical protein